MASNMQSVPHRRPLSPRREHHSPVAEEDDLPGATSLRVHSGDTDHGFQYRSIGHGPGGSYAGLPATTLQSGYDDANGVPEPAFRHTHEQLGDEDVVVVSPLQPPPPSEHDSDDGELVSVMDAMHSLPDVPDAPKPLCPEPPPLPGFQLPQSLADVSDCSPVKAEVKSPEAPGAPQRPLSAAKRKSPVSPELAQLFEQIAAVPELDVKLEYTQVPCGEETSVDVMVTVKPPLEAKDAKKKKKLYVVLCLDESYSMEGPKNELLHKFMLENLIPNGLRGVDLHLRILSFGDSIRDWKMGTSELQLLDADTRTKFKTIVKNVVPCQGATNIGAPVLRGIRILKDFRRKAKDRGEHLDGSFAVVTLTDGDANQGIRDGKELALNVRVEGAAMEGISTHYIGLGIVNSDFMKAAVDNGNLGIFSWAPAAPNLDTAFEEVLGAMANTSDHSFNFRFFDINGGSECDFALGMLSKPRKKVLTVAFKGLCKGKVQIGMIPFVMVQLLDNDGNPMGRVVHKEIEVRASGGVGRRTAGFAGKDKADAVLRERDAALARVQSMEQASQALHDLALRTASQMTGDVEEDEALQIVHRSLAAAATEAQTPTYRGLSAAAPALFAARVTSLEVHR